MLVDTRPDHQRRAYGEVPGAVVIDRNVLEWRLDPACDACLAEASSHRDVVVVCNEGYSSTLAAASLLDLGVNATDVIGGYRAWRDLGLPTQPFDD